MARDNFILALFALCMALAIAGKLTEGPPIIGGIDVREEYRAVPPITHHRP